MFNEEEEAHEAKKDSKAKIISIIYQIVFIDIVLSFDSIIAAIAMSPNNITVIIIAVIISLIIMLLFSGSLGEFINKHQSIKILGLVFIFFVGIMLFGEGFKVEISKAYLYFSIVFSLITESINILLSKKRVK
jgi:predicted tellurium resistance membrane protein TerC